MDGRLRCDSHHQAWRINYPEAMRILSFTASTEGQNRLGLRERLREHDSQQWTAVHLTPEQAAESVLDRFKRTVRQELDLDCREA